MSEARLEYLIRELEKLEKSGHVGTPSLVRKILGSFPGDTSSLEVRDSAPDKQTLSTAESAIETLRTDVAVRRQIYTLVSLLRKSPGYRDLEVRRISNSEWGILC